MSQKVEGPVPGEVVSLSPRVRRITQDNPGIFTGRGTNTHLLGHKAVFILDPGPDNDDHFQRILEAVASSPVLAVISTHSHPDHWPLAPRLARHYGVEVLGFEARSGFQPHREVVDGEVLRGADVTVEAIHTPGHASDHLCYWLKEERALMSGDHVMGWSTSVISPPDGNLNQYLAALVRLETLEAKVMYPAHGLPIHQPRARIQELLTHRNLRTRQALAALREGLETIPALVEKIYSDVDPRLHPAAGQSLLAHLLALVEKGQVTPHPQGPEGNDPLRVRYRLVDGL